MAKYKVLIPQDIVEEGKAYLRDRGYEIKMGKGITVEQIKEDVVDCDAILARTTPFPAEVLEAGNKLRVVGRHGVGVDNIDVKRATELGIYVTNARESICDTVAELVVGLIIALGRNMVRGDKAVRANDFEIRNRLKGIDLKGKTLGILGLGKIGQQVALKAHHGLSMNIIGYDPFLKASECPEEVVKVDDCDEIFKKSDFISVHIPSTKDTKRSIGKREFEMMKPSAYFINTARGDIVNEKELISVLDNKGIAGAGLDVFEQEPPAQDHPLYALDNVILTPHNASLTTECMIRMAVTAAQGIHEVLSGQKPTYPVNDPETN